MRVARWVQHTWPWIPYSGIQRAIRRGLIRVDSRKVSPSYRLSSGELIDVREKWIHDFQAPQEAQSLSHNWQKRLESWVIYEDDHLMAFHKPSGIACQGGSGQFIHMDALLLQWRPREKLRLVHRLDKETSGVLIVAKKLSVAQKITHLFACRSVTKEYWAIVQGTLDSKGVISKSLEKSHQKMIISPQGLSARTAYTVLGHGKLVTKEGEQSVTVVRLHPTTGRTHQLRVHMADRGHPIWGDKLYGTSQNEGLMLHCKKIQLVLDGHPYEFEAPLPQDFSELLIRAKISIPF